MDVLKSSSHGHVEWKISETHETFQEPFSHAKYLAMWNRKTQKLKNRLWHCHKRLKGIRDKLDTEKVCDSTSFFYSVQKWRSSCAEINSLSLGKIWTFSANDLQYGLQMYSAHYNWIQTEKAQVLEKFLMKNLITSAIRYKIGRCQSAVVRPSAYCEPIND